MSQTKTLVYEAILGIGEDESDPKEIIKIILNHLDVVASEGRLLEIDLHATYKVTLGATEDDSNPKEVMEIIRGHLNAVAKEGRRLEIRLHAI